MTDWAIVVGLHNWAMTKDAIADLLAQIGVAVRVLYVDQGSDDDTRAAAKAWAEREPRLLVWTHDPCLPSLSATWNLALRFVWGQGGGHALVVNNDVRLHETTYELLVQAQQRRHALFVSAVGVTERQYEEAHDLHDWNVDLTTTGGPDFSCFLITAGAHLLYPFDEGFSPAYCEDLDLHRRFMLGGDGAKIFSVNLPYLHYASGTLKALDPERRRAWEGRIAQSRAYYARKWGGGVNQERWAIPFEGDLEGSGSTTHWDVTTPTLQRQCADGSLSDLLDAIHGTGKYAEQQAPDADPAP